MTSHRTPKFRAVGSRKLETSATCFVKSEERRGIFCNRVAMKPMAIGTDAADAKTQHKHSEVSSFYETNPAFQFRVDQLLSNHVRAAECHAADL